MSGINNIWLVNKYAMPPQYESRLRTIKFAHYLQEMGYKVTLFGASVMHNMDLDLIGDNSKFIEKKYDDLHFVHINQAAPAFRPGVFFQKGRVLMRIGTRTLSLLLALGLAGTSLPAIGQAASSEEIPSLAASSSSEGACRRFFRIRQAR